MVSAHTGAPSYVQLLGSVRAEVAGQVCNLGSPKQHALLALLALEPGRVVSADRLISELWGDTPHDTALSTLQVYVSRLRRAFADAARAAAGSEGTSVPSVVRRSPGYVLDIDPDAVDVVRFRRIVAAAGQGADGQPRAALKLVDEALELVVGDPLADVADRLGDVTQLEARRIADEVLNARELRISLLLEVGEAATAVSEAAALAGAHPLRESVHVLLVRGLYLTGRQAEALAAYDDLRARLADELGIDPGPELRRLHGQVLRHDPALEPVARPPVDTDVASDEDPAVLPVAAGGLVGRDEPWRRLRGALRRLTQGQGSVLMLTGPAGIGKTKLCEELFEEAADHVATAWGRADESSAATPFWVWSQVLRALPDVPLDPGVRAVLEGTAVPADGTGGPDAVRVRDVVCRLIVERSRTSPLLIVLDDLQWADEQSVALLGSLGEHAHSSGVMLVVTIRSERADETTATADLLARWARMAHAERISLEELAEDDAVTLLAGRLRSPVSADALHAVAARAGGNPFYLIELARLIDETGLADEQRPAALTEVPRTVRDVLARRFRALTPGARRVLDVAAVGGRHVALSLLEEVAAMSPDELDGALEESIHAGLLTEVTVPRPGVRFEHLLVQETVYAEMRPLVRTRLHGAYARAMTSSPRHHDADAVAVHLTEGLDALGPERSVPALLEAAEAAVSHLAHLQAERLLDHLQLVLDRVEPGDDTARWLRAALVLRTRIEASRSGWASADTGRLLDRIGELPASSGADHETLDVLASRVRALVRAGDAAGLRRAVATGRPDVGAADAGRMWEALVAFAHGAAAWLEGDDVAAVQELALVVDLPRPGPGQGGTTGDGLLLSAASLLVHALVGCGRADEATDVAEQTRLLAGETPSTTDQADATVALAVFHAATGDPGASGRCSTAVLRKASQGAAVGSAVTLAQLLDGWAGVVRLDLTDDETRLRRLAALRKAHGQLEPSAHGLFGAAADVLLAEAEQAAGHPDLAAVLTESDGEGPALWVRRRRDLRARAARALARPS